MIGPTIDHAKKKRLGGIVRMRRGQLLVMLMIVFGFCTYPGTESANLALAREGLLANTAQPRPVPQYAKWGRYAMHVTQKSFPTAAIQDYLYVGRFPKSGGLSDEVFRLVLSKDGNLKTVIVVITVETKSQTLRGSVIQNLETSPYKEISDQIVRERH
jgi:hypothetical protein